MQVDIELTIINASSFELVKLSDNQLSVRFRRPTFTQPAGTGPNPKAQSSLTIIPAALS